MYRFLLQGRWIALTLLLVVLVPLSVVAADWQWNRWESRKALNASVTGNGSKAPAALALVAPPGSMIDDTREWRQVTATGTYLNDQTRLLRRQVVQGQSGFIVVTPLATADGHVALIERGFMSLPPSGVQVSAPPGATGEVTVIGRLRAIADNDAVIHPNDVPADQINRIDTATFAAATGLTVFPGIVELTGSIPPMADGLTPLPAPALDEGPHLSYVGQWGLIGLASIVVWIIMVRREGQHQRELRKITAPDASS